MIKVPFKVGDSTLNLGEGDRIGNAASIKQWAESHPEITCVILFGSRVRGDHRPDSDLDIAVELAARPGDTDAFTTWTCDAETWRRELGELLPHPIDLQWHDPGGKTPTITAGLERGSRVIFRRESSR